MLKKMAIVLAVSAAAMCAATNPGMAQTKLKWAHVYETSEPFHTASVCHDSFVVAPLLG